MSLTKDDIRVGMRLRGEHFDPGTCVEVIYLGEQRFFGRFHYANGRCSPTEASYTYDFGWTEVAPEPEPRDVRLELLLLQEELISLQERKMAPLGPVAAFARIVERLLELLQQEYQ